MLPSTTLRRVGAAVVAIWMLGHQRGFVTCTGGCTRKRGGNRSGEDVMETGKGVVMDSLAVDAKNTELGAQRQLKSCLGEWGGTEGDLLLVLHGGDMHSPSEIMNSCWNST